MAKVMLIEDDESLRILGERCLKRDNHDVIVRENTDKAIGIASLFKPDLIITDHNLGTQETGLVFAEKAKDAGFKVVMFTATDIRPEARKLNIPVFLKPYLIKNIVKEVINGK